MTTHTPGPWTIEPTNKWSVETNARAIIDKDRFPVAWSPAWDVDDTKEGGGPASIEEAEANARLIAAAPELLSKLRLAAFWLEYLIEDLEIDTGTTVANVNAVNRENGNVRTLASVSLETGWRDIQAAIKAAA